jgi:hypothetical protein
MSPWHLLPFVAPGALMGMGASWARRVASRDTWTWDTAWRAGFTGGLLGAPLISLYIALQGDLRPDRMLAAFVWLAWGALIIGAADAAIRALLTRRS